MGRKIWRRGHGGIETSLKADPRVIGGWGSLPAAYERDSCGFGWISSLDDQASHWVLRRQSAHSTRMTHRVRLPEGRKTGVAAVYSSSKTPASAGGGRGSGIKLATVCRRLGVIPIRDPGFSRLQGAEKFDTEQLPIEKLEVAGFRVLPVGHRRPAVRRRSSDLPTIEAGVRQCGPASLTRPPKRKLFAGAPRK